MFKNQEIGFLVYKTQERLIWVTPKNQEPRKEYQETENKNREMEFWRIGEWSMQEILHTMDVEILLRAPKTELFFLCFSITPFLSSPFLSWSSFFLFFSFLGFYIYHSRIPWG
jgi:hypothetical protein